MNLHQIVRGCIPAVNPDILVTIQKSTGVYITNANGSRTPLYTVYSNVLAQMQPLQYSDIQMMDGLNIQGERRVFYLNGDWQSLSRPTSEGGDLITLADGSIWMVAMTLENFSFTAGWTKVAATLQNRPQ